MKQQTKNPENAGKFIVLYGINNLGKTTQAKLLVEWLKKQKKKAKYLKYAVYDLEPSGTILNDYLRNSNPDQLSPREFQLVQCLNKTQYQPILEQELQDETWIIAEDYVGTSIAWGTGAGIDQNFLKQVNSHLRKPDFCFWFDGDRFMESQETNHKHETDDKLITKVRQIHQELAKKEGWTLINANESISDIHVKITEKIKMKLLNW